MLNFFSEIDADDVSLVVNYDMPVTNSSELDYETYLRLISRCGHFGRLGMFIFSLKSFFFDI
jgi:ATP-dependent RNA helicase DDX19/DBP5